MTKDKTDRENAGAMARRTQEALAALIRNTRTTSRALSLVQIEEWLRVAVEGLGSVKAVADRIDITPKMLRQFHSVANLSGPVRKLFASRKIDSVDAAAQLSKLEPAAQLRVAKELASGEIDTSDVRAILDLVKRKPQLSLSEVIRNIKQTRNVRQYVVEFVVRNARENNNDLCNKFASVVGAENIVSLLIQGSIGRLVLSERGNQQLAASCRSANVSKRRAVTSIAEGENL